MLKEIFVIGQGIPFFHYPGNDDTDDNEEDILLSSGFLSAIKDFSESARSDVLDSFSTDSELFLFKKCCDTDKELVGVFDRTTPEHLARKTLEMIHNLIAKTQIPQERQPNWNTPEKKLLKENIAILESQFFGGKGHAAYVIDLLNQRTNIPLAFLLDADEKMEIAHFARPKHLFKEKQIRDFFLVFSTLRQTLSKLGISDSFSYFTIRSQEYVIASCWSGRTISVATGALQTPEKEVLDTTLNMCYHPSLNSLVNLSDETKTLNRSTLLKDGNIVHEEGELLPPLSGIILSTLVNNLNGLFKSLVHRSLNEFEVIVAEGSTKRLSIIRKGSSEDFTIELAQHL